MFVIKHRHNLVVLFKRLGYALEEATTWIQMLANFVKRVIPMLRNADNSIDRNTVGSGGHSAFDRIKHGYAILFAEWL